MSQLGSLKRFLDKKQLKKVIFTSENQKWYDDYDPCKLELSFDEMIILESSNVIFLRSGNNILSLSDIKSVRRSYEAMPLGILITVTCEDKYGLSKAKSYILIAQCG